MHPELSLSDPTDLLVDGSPGNSGCLCHLTFHLSRFRWRRHIFHHAQVGVLVFPSDYYARATMDL